MGVVVFLAGLAFAAVAVLLVFTGIVVVGAVFFKIALKLILLPLLLLKWIVMGVVLMVVGPILVVIGIVAAFAMMLPLLPFVALGAVLWLLVRSSRRPAAVA